MAWIEQLPSGKYRGVYRDANGVRRSAGAFTHKAWAMREANRVEAAERDRAQRFSQGRMTWAEWQEQWWPTRTVEPTTLAIDESRLRVHVLPRWADVPLRDITRQDIKAWYSELHHAGLSKLSARKCVALLGVSLSAAVDAEVLAANPAARIKFGIPEVTADRYLTRDEYAAIRDELPTTFDQLVCDVLVRTGMRWGELAGLHRHRLYLDRGLVLIAETLDRQTRQVKDYPKGRQSRQVPLTPELIAGLSTLDVSGPCGRHVRCQSGLVFVGERGAPLNGANWRYRVWTPAVERSGVGHVRPHDLRHTYASWLLQGGVSLAEVGKLMGHVSPRTTERYARLAAEPSAAVLEALK